MSNRKLHGERGRALVIQLPQLKKLARILATSREQADDMAQDALLHVWARLEQGHDIRNLRPYLMTTLRHVRHASPQAEQELTEVNMPSSQPQGWPRVVVREVAEAIERLPDDQRELLHAMVYRGHSYRELSDQFDLPLGTVMSRISRARETLRRQFGLHKQHAVDELMDQSA